MADDRNRVRIYAIGEGDVLDAFYAPKPRSTRCVLLPRVAGLPEGYDVLSVHHNWKCKQFEFTVRHPSFDVVKPLQEIPVFQAYLESVKC